MGKKDNYSIRMNFYMKPDLVAVIDEYANSLGVSRGAAINIICSLWRDGRKIQNDLSVLTQNMGVNHTNINPDDVG